MTLIFGRKVDNVVLNLNPKIGGETVLRFPKKSKIAAKWPTNILAHILTSTAAMTLIFGVSVDNNVLTLNPRIGKEMLLWFPKKSKMAAKWPTNTF